MKHIDFIESVQRIAAKQLSGMIDLDYPKQLRFLKIPTLSYRRVRGDMIEMYKITHDVYLGLVLAVTAIEYNIFAHQRQRGRIYCTNSTMEVCNSLLGYVVTVKSTNSLKID